jgi:hypothetical protein
MLIYDYVNLLRNVHHVTQEVNINKNWLFAGYLRSGFKKISSQFVKKIQ